MTSLPLPCREIPIGVPLRSFISLYGASLPVMTALLCEDNPKDVRDLHTHERNDRGVPVQGSCHVTSNELILSRPLRNTRDQRIGQRTEGHNPWSIRMWAVVASVEMSVHRYIDLVIRQSRDKLTGPTWL